MSRFTIRGNGAEMTLPYGFDIAQETVPLDVSPVKILGRRGGIVQTFGDQIQPRGLRLAHYIQEDTESALATALKNIAEPMAHSTPALLTDNYLDRQAHVWLTRTTTQRSPGALLIPIAFDFLAPRGVWEATSETITQLTTAANGSNNLLRIDNDGSAPCHCKIMAIRSGTDAWTPSITRYGKNLVEDSSFESWIDVGTYSGPWTKHGSPRLMRTASASGANSVYVYHDSSAMPVNNYLSQTVPVRPLTQYTFSFVARSPAGAVPIYNKAVGGANLLITMQWKSGADMTTDLTSTTAWTFRVTNDDWQLNSLTSTSPANATGVQLIVYSNQVNHGALIDDWQLQYGTGATIGGYQDTSSPRLEPATIERSEAMPDEADAWFINTASARAQLRTDSAWTEDSGNASGEYFQLWAGDNHLHFSGASSAIAVEIAYRPCYLI